MSNGVRDFNIEHGRKQASGLDGTHLFERTGKMGKAPFRCTGFAKTSGSSCEYCGTGCIYRARIESSDGVVSFVGLDCANKTGDAGLVRNIKYSPEYRALQRAKRHAKDEANKAEIATLLADPRMTDIQRHGFGYRLGWCGAAGRARLLSEMRKAVQS